MTKRRPPTVEEIVEAIANGDLPTGVAVPIARACIEKAQENGEIKAWRLEWKPEQLVVTEEDMTPEDFRVIEATHRIPWQQVNPVQADAPMGLVSTILALHLGRRDKIKYGEAIRVIESQPVMANLALSEYEVPAPFLSAQTTG